MWGIALSFSLLIQYHKHLERSVFYAILSYFVLPVIATVITIFYYGLSLQNIALVISTQIMFAVDMIDVSLKLQKAQKAFLQASYEAEHDPMTKLLNKSAGMEKMKRYLNSMCNSDCASLLFVDIDDFKSINDSLGHAVGDYWIVEIAQLLHALCTSEDIVCRFGGDNIPYC